MSTALDDPDLQRIETFLAELDVLWRAPDPNVALHAALHRLVETGVPWVVDWLGEGRPEEVPLDPAGASEAPWSARWGLPPRIARVAALMMRGHSDKEIAEELRLSHATVRTYAAEVLRRAGVASRAQLLASAARLR